MRRVGLVGTYGNGNLGDEAIFVSCLQWMSRAQAGLEPIAITPNPDYVHRAHGIESVPLAGDVAREMSHRPRAGETVPTRHETPHDMRRATLAAARARVRSTFPSATRTMRNVVTEVDHARKGLSFLPQQLRIARGFDEVVVLGGGQIHDFWDGPWGHPFALFSWSLACRLLGKPTAILSIGGVPLQHALSRFFVRHALDWAWRVSVRDKETAELARAMGYRGQLQIVADLALDLAVENDASTTNDDAGQARPGVRVVGISPMAYMHPSYWPEGDRVVYERYIQALAGFIERLSDLGYRVVLLATQVRSDRIAIDDTFARLSSRAATVVTRSEVTDLSDLIASIDRCDALVASRFHGVLLSLLRGKPVISISYQPKNDSLLEQFGVRRFALDVHTFLDADLWECFTMLLEQFEDYRRTIPAKLASMRLDVETQFREVLGHESTDAN